MRSEGNSKTLFLSTVTMVTKRKRQPFIHAYNWSATYLKLQKLRVIAGVY